MSAAKVGEVRRSKAKTGTSLTADLWRGYPSMRHDQAPEYTLTPPPNCPNKWDQLTAKVGFRSCLPMKTADTFSRALSRTF
jgi:hypothetical protein